MGNPNRHQTGTICCTASFFDVDPHPHFNVAVAGQILPLVQSGIFLCFCVIVIYYYYLLYG